LDHDDFYGSVYNGVTLKQGIYRKRLVVKNGTFFTHLRNESTYDVVGGPKPQTGIYIASMVGLGIQLGPGECLSFKQNSKPAIPGNPPICGGSGATYEMHFSNECRKPNDKLCDSSDFHLNFDSVDIPAGERFEVLLNTKHTTTPPGLCKLERGGKEYEIRVSDEAPCMGVGYGGGGAMPPYPPG
jgi:hypothetical protein